MRSLLIVADPPFGRDVTTDALRAKGYTTFTAGNGIEAFQSLHDHAADLIILDVEMPGMQGLSFLEKLRKNNDWKQLPVIMLTGDMHRDHVILAKKLGAVDYLLKARFSLPELLSRVERSLGAAPSVPNLAPKSASQPSVISPKATEVPHLLTHDQCIARAEKALAGRNISLTVTEVISMTGSSHSDLPELPAMLGRDPLLSARVLQMSNRAAYASGHGHVTTLSEAVRLLGCSTIREIAISVGIIDAMPAPSSDGFDPIRSWQHALAVAKLCGSLAPPEISAAAYLVGLCHDLGDVLFRTEFAAEYQQVLDAQAATGKPLDELEHSMLGITHGQLVQTILRCLDLPPIIARPIADYHGASIGSGNMKEPLGRILHMADLYATGILIAQSAHSVVRPLSRSECRKAVGVDDPPRPDAAMLRGEIYALTALCAPHSGKSRDIARQPLYARRPVRLLVARDPLLSSFDPVCAALESLAEVTIMQRLPTPSELADYQGLIILTRNESIDKFAPADVAAAAKRGDDTTLPLLSLSRP